MKLLMSMLEQGTVDVTKHTVKELGEFCEEHGLNVDVNKPVRAKDKIINDIFDAVELSRSANEGSQVVEDEADPKPVVHYRKNGERIQLSRGGNDYGCNWLNRQGK